MVVATMAATTQYYYAPLVLWVLALQICSVSGGYEHTCDLSTRMRGAHRQGVCGGNLASLVSLLCEARGHAGRFSMHPDKRSVRDTTGLVDDSLRGILLNKREALSYLYNRVARGVRDKRRNGVQGITCECCYNACSINELLEYCR